MIDVEDEWSLELMILVLIQRNDSIKDYFSAFAEAHTLAVCTKHTHNCKE